MLVPFIILIAAAFQMTHTCHGLLWCFFRHERGIQSWTSPWPDVLAPHTRQYYRALVQAFSHLASSNLVNDGRHTRT